MRLALVVALACGSALAVASAASAAVSADVAGSESFSLRYGVGYAVVFDRGAVLGRVRRGVIRVADVPSGGAPSGFVRGCERRSGSLAGKLVCRGTDLRLYVHGGTWRIRISGRGVNVSGVVRGRLGLDRADSGTGLYSIGDAAARRWPASLTFFAVRS
jgi:hypothetical protein